MSLLEQHERQSQQRFDVTGDDGEAGHRVVWLHRAALPLRLEQHHVPPRQRGAGRVLLSPVQFVYLRSEPSLMFFPRSCRQEPLLL